MSDEEPETWDVLVARDLKTDRVSANHQRMISYAYTNTAFIPPAILPGFAFHQTDRSGPPRLAVALKRFAFGLARENRRLRPCGTRAAAECKPYSRP